MNDPIELLTERLLLRDIAPGDAPYILRYFAEPEAQEHILRAQRSTQQIDAMLRWAPQQAAMQPRSDYRLTVALRHSGEIVGLCTLSQARLGSPCALLGWHLSQRHSGWGYATEMAAAALRFAFEELFVRRICADCFADNRRSRRVMEKIGLRPQRHARLRGWLLRAHYREGRAIVRYGVTAEEWCSWMEAREADPLDTFFGA